MFRKVLSSMNLADYEEPVEPLPLPDEVLADIADRSGFFELLKLKKTNRFLREYVGNKLRKVTKMHVWVVAHPELNAKGYYKHKEAHVSVKLEEDIVHIIMDDDWTGIDVLTVINVMDVFHEWVENVEIDSVVAEIIVVSLGSLDIPSWYNFQSGLLGFQQQDEDIHMTCATKTRDTIYWPKVSELTVHTDARHSNYLSRLLDYGIHSKYILDRTVIDKVRVVLEDITMNKVINRHIYHFRCWAGSAGFDHRYEVQYVHNGVVTKVNRVPCVL